MSTRHSDWENEVRNIPKISEEEGKYLVRFHIEGVRSLIGNR